MQQGIVDNFSYSNTVASITWSGLNAASSDGSPSQWAEYADRSFTVTGTFGVATLTLQGSNDNVNWFTLHDVTNTPLTATTPKLAQVLEITHYVRPLVTAADGTTNLTVILVMRRDWK